MNFLEKLGKNIKRIRTTKSLTQSNLAEMADVSVSTIARLEIGQSFTTYQTIEKIAKALNIELEEIFDVSSINIKNTNQENFLKEISKILKTNKDYEFILKVAKAHKEIS